MTKSNYTPIKKLSERDNNNFLRHYGIYLCSDCDKEYKSRLDREKKTSLCAVCALSEGGKRGRTHGYNNKNSRLHVTWSNMKRRCLNPTEKELRNYGANLYLCDEWHDFELFMDWSLSNGYTDSLTIDRIKGSKGYYPENCRFVGYSTLNANKALSSKNKSGYIGILEEPDGKYSAMIQWH